MVKKSVIIEYFIFFFTVTFDTLATKQDQTNWLKKEKQKKQKSKRKKKKIEIIDFPLWHVSFNAWYVCSYFGLVNLACWQQSEVKIER